MSMGYGANFAEVIEVEDLRKMDFDSFTLLLENLEKLDVSLDLFACFFVLDAKIVNSDGVEIKQSQKEELYQVLDDFLATFREEFGLSLNLGYHSSEDSGDKYDEVDGAYFYLDFSEIYQLSNKAYFLINNVPFRTKLFVTYG